MDKTTNPSQVLLSLIEGGQYSLARDIARFAALDSNSPPEKREKWEIAAKNLIEAERLIRRSAELLKEEESL